MTKLTTDKLTRQTWFTSESVIYWGIIWATVSIALYLNFSVVDPNTDRPIWFILVTTGLEEIGLIISGCLCLRNYWSEYISGSRVVWLLFAIAMFAFFVGNLWFCLWELVWKLDPVAAVGSIVGCWLTTLSATAAVQPISIVRMAAASSSSTLAVITAPRIPTQTTSTALERPPEWVLAIDRSMQPLVTTFNLFYVLCDLVLLTFAAILLLGFWGGQLGLPWRMMAQAVLCFYLADTWFAYANHRVQGYESGSIMEVFWIFGIVQFGIAAALEFDNSIRARRLARRRTAIN